MRVLIVDDHLLFAEAIRPTLEASRFDVIAIETTAAGGIRAAREHRPDLVLLDIGLPDRSGISVGREILDEAPETSVVAVTALDAGRLVRDALRVGFAGFITKGIASDEFVRSLCSIVDGQLVLPQKLAKAAHNGNGYNGAGGDLLDLLTRRETEVLRLLCEGMGSEAIAEELHVTVTTARTHIQNVLTKLGVHSRLEAATLAVRHGFDTANGRARLLLAQ